MLTKFNGLPIGKRLGILVALAAGVAALVSVTLWTQQPDMQILFANLATEDAGAIVEKLKENKVPYEIGAGGGSILVPSAQVHDLRLQMAGQGLPHGGGVGFEIFDRSTLGMSEFVQKLNYRRALQGELARTITQMPDVARARVHLAVPERRLFSGEHDRPRASVVLSLRGSNALSRGQIQGIVHLVASSVEGLQPRDVTVVDGNGRLLSEGGGGGDGATRLTGSQLDYQRTLEKDIELRIQSMLERIVGNNKAVVRVSSVLDLRQVEMTEERYDPNGQVARSEQRTQEKATGTNGVTGGVPGVASNVPPGQSQEAAQTSSTNTANKNEVINYEISRTVAKIIEPIGTIKQLSVAVLVDGNYEPAKEGGSSGTEAVRKYVPRSEADMKQIEDIVKKAMGYSADRQDQVEVVNVQFGFEADTAGGTAASAEEASSFVKTYAPYIRHGVGAVLFLLIFLFVVRPLVAALTAPSPALPQERMGGAAATVLPQGAALGLPQSQVLELARSNPESTAVVVKEWLKSGA
jgi:flagellar M-ring protein FliF